MSLNFNIELKQDDPQRVIELNGVPTRFYATAEEFNLLVMVINHLLGKESALYKGEFDFIEELEEKHPLPEPGSYAHLRVVDGDDIFCRWDNTNKKWIQDGLVKDQPEVNIGVAENIRAVLEATGTKYYGTKDGVYGVWPFPEGTGGGTTSPSTTKMLAFVSGWDEGFTYYPYARWNHNGVEYTDTRERVLDPADATYNRIDLFTVNLVNGTIEVLKGIASANPVKPEINPETHLEGPFVLVAAGAIEPVGASKKTIFNEGLGLPDEWEIQANHWILSENSSFLGAKSLEGSNLVKGAFIKMNPPGGSVLLSEISQLELRIKNKVASSGEMRMYFHGNKANGQTVSYQEIGRLLDFGYDPTNIVDWQKIILPVSAPGVETLRNLYIQSDNETAEGFGCFIDAVLQGSTNDEGNVTEVDGVTEAELNAALLALENDLALQIDDVEEDVLVHEQRLTDLENAASDERKIKIVSTSRDFTNDDHDYTLLVVAAITLTYPAIGTLRADFGCEVDTDAAGTVAIGGDSTVLDNLVGATIAENSMATLQARPDNRKLRGKGEIILP